MDKTEKHKEICESKGLEYIGFDRKRKNQSPLHLCINKKCGHISSFNMIKLKKTKNDPFCNICRVENLKKQAKLKKLIYIGNAEKKSHHLYKFEGCEHIIEYKPSSKTPYCHICELEKFKNEALEKGLKMLDYKEKGKYEYECLYCKKITIQKPSIVRRNNPKSCSVCVLENLKKEAKKEGLTILRKSKKQSYYFYKFDKCNHEIELRPSVLRISTPSCSFCEETYASKPSNIYIIRISDKNNSFIKLGIANNIEHRVKGYGLKKGYKVEILEQYPYDTFKKAVSLEKKIHRENKSKRLPINKMKLIMNNGFTECYPENTRSISVLFFLLHLSISLSFNLRYFSLYIDVIKLKFY